MKMKGTGRGQKKKKVDRQRKTFKRAYLSKAQSARRLQVTSAEFERLAILKGIYPREPKRFEGSQGKDKTYYFSKDVLWLEREPMLEKIREYSTFQKKMSKLRGRREHFDANIYQQQHKPQYSLTTILKERYPTFNDALRDCDDALTHIFLYAALPARVHSDTTIEGHTHLTSAMSDQCKDIRSRWLKYMNSTKSVRRVFISIKGIYYQGKVKGETVTWQCPYEFTSKPPKDVIYRIMITFLELYITQMKFILFRLEHDLKAEEERVAVAEEEDEGAEKAAEDFPKTQAEQASAETALRLQNIFTGLKFYISREVPAMHLGFVVSSFGGTVVDDANATGLTHYIIDRPQVPNGETQRPGVDYVQPQWLFDCVNAKGRLPADEYLIGKQLPAHISPFRLSISNDADEIAEIQEAIKTDRRILEHDVPDRVHEIRRMLDPSYNKVNATAEVALSEDDDDDLDGQDQIELDNESHSEEVVSDSDSEGVKEFIERSKVSKKKVQKQLAKGDNKPTTKEAASKKRKRVEDVREKRATDTLENRKKIKLEEAHAKAQADKEMKMHVMPTKAKKLYGAMQHGIKQRKEQLDQLEDRREKIRGGDAALDPKTRTLKMKKSKK